jgi:hypothetical protein
MVVPGGRKRNPAKGAHIEFPSPQKEGFDQLFKCESTPKEVTTPRAGMGAAQTIGAARRGRLIGYLISVKMLKIGR